MSSFFFAHLCGYFSLCLLTLFDFLRFRTLVDKDIHDSGMEDEFSYAGYSSETSEFSSLSDYGEQFESGQLNDHPNSLFGFEQKYFSALSFSMSAPMGYSLQKPLQSEIFCNMKSGPNEISKKCDAVGYLVLSQNKRMILSGTSELLESENLNLSGRDVRYTDGQPNNHWPFGSLMKSPFCVDGRYRHPELHQLDSGLKVYNANMDVPKEGLSYCSKTIGIDNVSIEETLAEDQFGKGCATSAVTVQEWKLNYNCNIFSINPMLTRSAFINFTSKTAERFTTDRRLSLPFFDFSSVEDPCNLCLGKLTAGSSPKIFENSSASAVNVQRDHHSQQRCAVHKMLTDKNKRCCAHPYLDSEDQSKDATATNVSGKNSWETLLFNSSKIDNNTVSDHWQSFSAIFEIPLDFIIDKCLLQEIQLQYPFIYAKTILTVFFFFFTS